jgi:glycosyltransferase involved in cell wall biosynthesis
MEALVPMKYYIAHTGGPSGIAEYSKNFYNYILKDFGYKSVEPTEILSSGWKRDDEFFIETGAGQYDEIDVLMELLAVGMKNISVTMHDPPFLRFPLYPSRNGIIDKILKGFQVYTPLFSGKKILQSLKNIYVLSDTAKRRLEIDLGLRKVHKIPLILDPSSIVQQDTMHGRDMAFFGFIGKKKGIEYALEMHREVVVHHPEIVLRVLGKAVGKAGERYYNTLRKKFQYNVEWLGFVPHDKIDELFKKTRVSILPFQEYGYMYPTSASILTSMMKGAVVMTTDVNTTSDIIKHGINGLFMSGNLKKDSILVRQVVEDDELYRNLRSASLKQCTENHSPSVVKTIFKKTL